MHQLPLSIKVNCSLTISISLNCMHKVFTTSYSCVTTYDISMTHALVFYKLQFVNLHLLKFRPSKVSLS